MTKITIQRDIVFNISVVSTHNYIPLPPFPPVPPPLPAAPLSPAAIAIETIVNAWWPPGYALGSNKFTTSVFHGGMGICLDGHDCGKFIPHVQVAPAPNNTLTLLHIPLSSRKCNFTASTVKMDGKQVACMLMFSWPPTPMTYCSEPMSMPLASACTAHGNTVTVGMTFGDWFAGAFAIAAGMLLEWCLFKRGGGAQGFLDDAAEMALRSEAGRYLYQIVAEGLVGEIKKKVVPWLAGQGVGILTGGVRMLATGEGEVGVSYAIGGPFLELKVGASVTRSNEVNPETGSHYDGGKVGLSGTALTAQGNLDTSGAGISNNHPLGVGSESVSHDWDKGTTQTSTDVDPFDGFHNTTTTQAPDGTTTVNDSQGGSPGLSNPL
jgi:hypothetical protein